MPLSSGKIIYNKEFGMARNNKNLSKMDEHTHCHHDRRPKKKVKRIY